MMAMSNDEGTPVLRWILFAVGLAVVIGGSVPVAAQPAPEREAGSDRDAAPDPERRRRAQTLMDEAVDLHNRLLFRRAIEKYRHALALWDHPYIRFSLSLALGAAGRHLEAYEELERALPELARSERQQALEYEGGLLGQLAQVSVRAVTPGAEVTFNDWSVSPEAGSEWHVLTPGPYVVAARKEGYYTETRSISVSPGTHGRIDVRLSPDEVIHETRWSWWIPVAVVGAGAALGGGGALLRAQARKHFAEYDEKLEGCLERVTCSAITGPDVSGLRSQGTLENRLSAGFLVAGGVALASGLTLLVLNRTRSRRSPSDGRIDYEIIPQVSGDGGGAHLRMSF